MCLRNVVERNKDEVGIPHTTMRDGAPNGYSIITFDGNKHVLDFKAARQPASYQMNIHAPDAIKQVNNKKHLVYVNVFNGSAKSKVKMKIGKNGDWIELQKLSKMIPPMSRQGIEKRRTAKLVNQNSIHQAHQIIYGKQSSHQD